MSVPPLPPSVAVTTAVSRTHVFFLTSWLVRDGCSGTSKTRRFCLHVYVCARACIDASVRQILDFSRPTFSGPSPDSVVPPVCQLVRARKRRRRPPLCVFKENEKNSFTPVSILANNSYARLGRISQFSIFEPCTGTKIYTHECYAIFLLENYVLQQVFTRPIDYIVNER